MPVILGGLSFRDCPNDFAGFGLGGSELGKDAIDLYLELLKKTLCFSLWPEPPVPIQAAKYQQMPLRRLALQVAARILRSRGLLLAKGVALGEKDREEGRIWPLYAETMIGLRRIENLRQCSETVLREGIAGDFIETGVWRGGACIFMCGVLVAHGILDRKVFVADSFQGLPIPDLESYPEDRGDVHHQYGVLSVTFEEVKANFEKYGLLSENVVFLRGWFKDTLVDSRIKKLAVLRLDGDMYGSTWEALTNLYPKLSMGGFCIVDDYALPGCRKAVDDYRARNSVTDRIVSIDRGSAFWRKSV